MTKLCSAEEELFEIVNQSLRMIPKRVEVKYVIIFLHWNSKSFYIIICIFLTARCTLSFSL